MERYIVACYDSTEGGYFRPHRDNTTKGTAHRRFAVTLNLNSDEYEGGYLRFRNSAHSCSRRQPAAQWCFRAPCCMRPCP